MYAGDERDFLPVSGKLRRRLELAQLAYETQVENDCKTLADFLYQQWPCSTPSAEGSPQNLKLNLESAMELIIEKWQSCFQNLELSNHVASVQRILDLIGLVDRDSQGPSGACGIATFSLTLANPGKHRYRLQQLMGLTGLERIENGSVTGGADIRTANFSASTPQAVDQMIGTHWTTGGLSKHLGNAYRERFSILARPERHAQPLRQIKAPRSHAAMELDQIVKTFTASDSAVRKQYGLDLKRSLDAFFNVQSKLPRDSRVAEIQILPAMINDSYKTMQSHLMRIRSVLQAQVGPAAWLIQGGLWPCISPVTILEQLRSISSVEFGHNMRETLVDFALLLTTCQRLRRLEEAKLKGKEEKLIEELKNVGHEN